MKYEGKENNHTASMSQLFQQCERTEPAESLVRLSAMYVCMYVCLSVCTAAPCPRNPIIRKPTYDLLTSSLLSTIPKARGNLLPLSPFLPPFPIIPHEPSSVELHPPISSPSPSTASFPPLYPSLFKNPNPFPPPLTSNLLLFFTPISGCETWAWQTVHPHSFLQARLLAIIVRDV